MWRRVAWYMFTMIRRACLLFSLLCVENTSNLCLLHTCFLFDLLYHPEDEGDMFLRNVGWFSNGYMLLQLMELFVTAAVRTSDHTQLLRIFIKFDICVHLNFADRLKFRLRSQNNNGQL
jgi:hypothetical protein